MVGLCPCLEEVAHEQDGPKQHAAQVPEEQVAQRTIIQLTDDLDGAAADRTVNFSYEGVWYELDLSTKNADKFGLLCPIRGSFRGPSAG